MKETNLISLGLFVARIQPRPLVFYFTRQASSGPLARYYGVALPGDTTHNFQKEGGLRSEPNEVEEPASGSRI